MSTSRDDTTHPLQRPARFGQTLKAVAWSFLGIRRAADYERDVQRLNPVHVILAGIFGAIVFIALLLLIIRWVVSSGVAA